MAVVWVCAIRKEAFVGGESQRCRHSETCETCGGTGKTVFIVRGAAVETTADPCPTCKGTGQVSECGEMELIGGEPIEWCVVHGAQQTNGWDTCWEWEQDTNCQFESQIRVGP